MNRYAIPYQPGLAAGAGVWLSGSPGYRVDQEFYVGAFFAGPVELFKARLRNLEEKSRDHDRVQDSGLLQALRESRLHGGLQNPGGRTGR